MWPRSLESIRRNSVQKARDAGSVEESRSRTTREKGHYRSASYTRLGNRMSQVRHVAARGNVRAEARATLLLRVSGV